MQVIKGLKALRSVKNSSVTVGVFDGVHIGHRKIIGKVVEAAKRAKPVLLEPIMKVEVIVPDKFLGEATGDLSALGF